VISPDSFDLSGSDALRAAFRTHGSGVAIVTSVADDGQPVGFTATSITSLGTNPPLISFNVAQGASFYSVLCRQGAKIAIHTLGAENHDLAVKLSGDRDQRFSGDSWVRGPHNLPVFPAASAVLIGQIRKVVEIERNAVVIADALIGSAGDTSTPLIYFQRGYLAGGERLSDNF
jgi:flavin reductase (DIM6/NTAB) family NADH-FMN oxidoreductase RutF